MTVQAEARQRLASIRQGRQPANDLLDGFLTIHTPGDIRAELDQLRASYDIVDKQAKGSPGWDTHYQEFLRFYEDTRPRTEGASGWLRTSNGTLENIRSRARRLEEWKQKFSQDRMPVAEPTKALPVDSGPGAVSNTLKIGLAGVGILLALKLVSK